MTTPPTAGARTWRPPFDVDVRRILGSLRRGSGDPTFTTDATGAIWRTSRLPDGPVTYRILQVTMRHIEISAWGDGAEAFLDSAPVMLGAEDEPESFRPDHPLLVDAVRRFPGIRMPRTLRVEEALIPAVLEQKVTGKQAFAAFRRLVTDHGDPAPGPTPMPMVVPPSTQTWRRIPSWEWHRAGVEPARSATIQRALRVMDRLQECTTLSPPAALNRLRLVPGIGEWTAAEIAQRALGDADALSVGDYHLAAFVGWSLLGRPLDDAGMVEFLEPWRGHRHRLVALLWAHPSAVKPRFGPRMTIQDHRRH